MSKIHQIQIEITVFENENELSKQDLFLLNEAREATKRAYAPYSKFSVGAAIQLQNGEIILGSNQENAAYPSGLCAERTAIFSASTQFPNEIIETIAIAAKPKESIDFIAISPCGSCRQVMSEYENKQNKPIRMIMEGENKSIYIVSSIANLLPLKFSKKSLDKKV
ncbi:cytidine deaminase [Bernardetia litoralis DSM 6794]|uniref:Cytidine deaminase n=1 Tax=Bernardetia litoralis (strain ATCC 23117 / DSM 6794 / NBRC 15988 / NCIMB 1366 / Fx l1 / Sio-4) TaxID=880071 RepID=I4AJ41_BERLS|nr:cytidine deaminase [Bernardetia litoralis]AFM03976.1 cytidine deaminase [Bernardetia litoralis DSM 6794]